MKRSLIYGLAFASGFLVGAMIGIDGRNCSHPNQPPLLRCATEDPPDVLIPAISLALLATAIVGAVDVVSNAVKKKSESQIPPWRRWLYVSLLVVVALPAAVIAIEQAAGGYSDGDPFLIFILGTWVLSPLILVEFVVWLLRRFNGAMRLIPFVALIAIGAMSYAATGDPDLACIDHSGDNGTCYDAMQFYITNFLLLCVMVGALFLPSGRSSRLNQHEKSESVRT